jgi:hypothetical protein
MPSQFRPAFQIANEIEDLFPLLKKRRWSIKSPWNDTYQCLAWAVCRTDVLWWPAEMYWPPSNPTAQDDIDAFIAALKDLRYVPCGKNDSYELGYQKIAIFAASDGRVLHMARQRLWGSAWLSKVGKLEDIVHQDLQSIEGDPSPIPIALGKSYGMVAHVLRRTWWSAMRDPYLFQWLRAATTFLLYRLRHPSWIRSNLVRKNERMARGF